MTVNVTRDVSTSVLATTLSAIFSDDYEFIAPHFQIIAEEQRDLQFTQTCSDLRKRVIDVAVRRRQANDAAVDIPGITDAGP